MLAQIAKEYPNDVRFVYRHFPLDDNHPNADLAARASESAHLQGKFWEFHDLLFSRQQTWSGLAPAALEIWLQQEAVRLGLDAARFAQDLKSTGVIKRVDEQRRDANRMRLAWTPSIFINGTMATNVPVYEEFSMIIRMVLLEDLQFSDCPPLTINPSKNYIARIITEKGEIVIQLYPDRAPSSVNSFIFLAKNGWYNRVEFHRVIAGFIAQAGDPSGTGLGGPGYGFGMELAPNLRFDRAGVVAMVNTGTNTSGSQFFITMAPTSDLNGKYTIFGQVIQGMDVVQRLTPRDPSKSLRLPPGDRILEVKIEEK